MSKHTELENAVKTKLCRANRNYHNQEGVYVCAYESTETRKIVSDLMASKAKLLEALEELYTTSYHFAGKKEFYDAQDKAYTLIKQAKGE